MLAGPRLAMGMTTLAGSIRMTAIVTLLVINFYLQGNAVLSKNIVLVLDGIGNVYGCLRYVCWHVNCGLVFIF